ncbi:MAG: flagellin [Phycisphaerae bacterium]
MTIVFVIGALSNTSALSARFQLNGNQSALFTSMQRLATGRKLNSGKDGPAALIASERLNAEIASLEAQTNSLSRANANANIADGHTAELATLFQDLNSLVVSSANQAGMSDAELAANQMQVDSIVASIQKFTGDAVSSLDGITLPGGGNQDVAAQLNAASAAAQTLVSGGSNDLASGNGEAAQAVIAQAITDVVTSRGTIGAFQRNTIGPQIRSNQIAMENLTDANSRIRDTDFAAETSNVNRLEVLTAANVKMLKIAQRQAASVLSLLTSKS